jgi:hypothetical protein
MSAIFDILASPNDVEEDQRGSVESVAPETAFQSSADNQLLKLVHELFFDDSLHPTRRVVFSGLSDDTGIAHLCGRIALVLGEQTAGRVACVETVLEVQLNQNQFTGGGTDVGLTPEPAGAVRTSSRQIYRNVWYVNRGNRNPTATAHLSLPLIRERMGELRREFEYVVIHAPPVARNGCTALWAQSADGIVLVVEANRTRRILAHRLQENLRRSNVRILGAVLKGRTFPIPERIYRRV